MDQNRVAAIAALNDFLEGRRSASSLRKYEQTYTVVRALKGSDSVLLREGPAVGTGDNALSGPALAARLWELEKALDEKRITYEEYRRRYADAVNGD